MFTSLQIKWGGAFQEGAGSTIGAEVEQVNRFLSRAAITTKYMSKAGMCVYVCVPSNLLLNNNNLYTLALNLGRTDMLTLLAWGWNKSKVENMGRTLSQRYLKVNLNIDIDSSKYVKTYKGKGLTLLM